MKLLEHQPWGNLDMAWGTITPHYSHSQGWPAAWQHVKKHNWSSKWQFYPTRDEACQTKAPDAIPYTYLTESKSSPLKLILLAEKQEIDQTL